MDPDSAGAEKSFSILPEGINPFSFFTSTISCSLLLISCHGSPDEKLVKAIAEKTDTARSKPVITQTVQPASNKKKIYLTFDDGPNKGTNNVVDILEDENVPASLFVIGEQVYGSRTQQQTWLRLRHCPVIELCNHSYTHAHSQYGKFYTDTTSVVSDFQRCHDSLQLANYIARTPGRNVWRTATVTATDLTKTQAAADAVQRQGFVLAGWDVEWHYKAPNLLLREDAATMLLQIDSLLVNGKTKIPGHIVLLAHDQTFEDRKDSASLRWLVQQIKQRDDYQLEKVSNYPGMMPQH